MIDWQKLSVSTKLNVLAGETTVMVSLLTECNELMKSLRNGCTMDEAITIINDSF